MQPTHATKMTRSDSDPGLPTSSFEDMERQPLRNVQHSIGGTSVPLPAELSAKVPTISLPSCASMGSGAPQLTPSTGMPEQEIVSADATTQTLMASALTEATEHPLPTMTQVQPTVQPPVGAKTGDPLSTIDHATPVQVNSAEAVTDAEPVHKRLKPASHGSTQKKVTSDHDKFLQKYSSILPPPEFEEFSSLISRERKFQAQIWKEADGGLYEASELTLSKIRDLEIGRDDILLIEDVDIRCVMALDAKFDLDPHFILNYAGFQKVAEHQYATTSVDEFHFAGTGTGTSGSWYTIVGKFQADCLRQTDDSPSHPRNDWQNALKLWEHRGASETDRPRCQELRRQGVPTEDSLDHSYLSVVACYCLSKTRRRSSPLANSRRCYSSHIGF